MPAIFQEFPFLPLLYQENPSNNWPLSVRTCIKTFAKRDKRKKKMLKD